MKKSFIILLFIFHALAFSQVGINTTAPKATLDVSVNTQDISQADGIIPPRVTGFQLKSKDHLYNSEQTGTIVYVNEPLSSEDTTIKTGAVRKVGYYYFDGATWKSFENGTLEEVVEKGNYTPKYITFIGSTNSPLRDGALGMSEETYSMYFGNMNPNHTGYYNLGFGYGALEQITTSMYSTAVGSMAGQKITTGNANSFFGDEAGANNTTGHKNSIFGMAAAFHDRAGSFNSIFGYKAGQFRNLGKYNVLIGNSAGSSSGTAPVSNLGNNNVFIGTGAGFGEANLNNKLIIHSNNSLQSADSNSVTNEGIFSDPGQSSLANALISGDFVDRWLKVNGRFQINPTRISAATTDYTKMLVYNPTDGEVGSKDFSAVLTTTGTQPGNPITGQIEIAGGDTIGYPGTYGLYSETADRIAGFAIQNDGDIIPGVFVKDKATGEIQGLYVTYRGVSLPGKATVDPSVSISENNQLVPKIWVENYVASQTKIPAIPSKGTFILQSVDGVIQWIPSKD